MTANIICGITFIHAQTQLLFVISIIIFHFAEILASKKKKYTDLARTINQTKVDIDKSRSKLDQLKEEREQAGLYTLFRDTYL